MPNHGAFLPIHLLHLENIIITFHGSLLPPNSPPKSPPKIPIGQPLGALPSPQCIPPTLNLLPPPPPLIQTTSHNIAQLLSNTSTPSAGAPSTAANISAQHMVGHGLPPVSKKLADRIRAGEFIDLAELPPAKGKVRPIQSPEGGVLLVSAHDLLQQKRLIPDLATWVQCFSLYTAIVCSQSPERITDLLGYMCQIVRASHRFKWPSWIIYDQNFRQEAAEHNQTSDWARIDSSLFAQCFTGQSKSSESWCKSCHSLDHLSDACPLRPPPAKRPKALSSRPYDSEVCRRFNTSNGGCPFGARCRYAHRCTKCGGDHPSKLCSAKTAATSSSSSKSLE